MNPISYQILGGDYEHGGAASRALKEQLKKVGADPAVIRRAMIAAYEAEMNVVIHASRGELKAKLENGQLFVEVVDEGPGIPDLEAALRPGFSTAPPKARELGFGAGMGLPNIRQNSDQFAIESVVGRGTTVRFSIILRPQTLYGQGRHSVHIAAERCRQSFRCLHACPTQAVRVYRSRPLVLDYLCIDCAACIAACPSGAFTTRGTVDDLVATDGVVLVVPQPVLTQFGAGIRPADVLAVLADLGFRQVWGTWKAEEALRKAVTKYADTEAPMRPVISPACPAVVNLIESRFPALIPHVAPFMSAVEALRAELRSRSAVFVVTCPGQRTAVLAGDGPGKSDVALPAALLAAVRPRLQGRRLEPEEPNLRSSPAQVSSSSTGVGSAHSEGRTQAAADRQDMGAAVGPPLDGGGHLLTVTGWRHVLAVLNAIEDGLANDLAVVEPWCCDEGCFGSPLLSENPFIARQRWAAPPDASSPAVICRRTTPLKPRAGLRLDEDMAKAITKLGRIDKLRRTLPGCDCGWCGAPTCAALAEDIVRGRAAVNACVRQSLAQEQQT